MKLRIIQNCFRAEQLASCTFEPYLNAAPNLPDERYLFFESDVIARLVRDNFHTDFDYFGVLGHRWQDKLREARSWPLPLRNLGQSELSSNALNEFVKTHPHADFISLGRFIPHRVFRLAEQIHPGWMKATTRLLEQIGIRFNLHRTVPQPIYYNYFVGKRDKIAAYVKELLAPAIEAVTHDNQLRELCLCDAGYFRDFPIELSQLFGIHYYPLHCFIGERLINIYILLSGSRVASFDACNGGRWSSRLFLATKPTYFRMKWYLEPWRRLIRRTSGWDGTVKT